MVLDTQKEAIFKRGGKCNHRVVSAPDHQKSAKTGEVLEHLMKDPRGAEIIARIKSLHPDSYRKRLVDRVKCAIRGK